MRLQFWGVWSSSFIAITPRSTLTWSDITFYGPTFSSNISVGDNDVFNSLKCLEKNVFVSSIIESIIIFKDE